MCLCSLCVRCFLFVRCMFVFDFVLFVCVDWFSISCVHCMFVLGFVLRFVLCRYLSEVLSRCMFVFGLVLFVCACLFEKV